MRNRSLTEGEEIETEHGVFVVSYVDEQENGACDVDLEPVEGANA